MNSVASRFLAVAAIGLGAALGAQAQERKPLEGQREALDRLTVESGAEAQVVIDRATGGARFVRAAPGASLGARSRARARGDAAMQSASSQFLRDYRSLFGMQGPEAELGTPRVEKDRHGGTHLTYAQLYRGLPVFGAQLKTHFDDAENLVVANGHFVPGIALDPVPVRSADEAVAIAVARVRADLGRPTARLAASVPALMVYREGLAQGVAGADRLAWEVEVGNRLDVRDFVFVDAHTGKLIDKIAGIHEAKNRRAFDGANATQPGPNYPGAPFWVEGQAFPTGTVEADNMIQASSEIYDLFRKAFGRDSFDGRGGRMDSIFDRGNGCPNASWNGTYISFCSGMTTDDITAHEWGHAYTEYTDALVYAWQPGALNEAYSDIWGETVDRINGRGGDTPDAARHAGVCTVSTRVSQVTLTAPAPIAGAKPTGTASFGPQAYSVAESEVVVVNDGGASGPATAGCSLPFVNAAAVAGKIAYVDRGGSCNFLMKARNAQSSGAVGVIVGNNVPGIINMTGVDPNTIPALSISQADGAALKAQAGAGSVRATMARGNGTDDSVRWLLGEDSRALGGAIRDMYTPSCFGHPGKVSDPQYACSPNTAAGDNGGVHINSGVVNHGYALVVDGGSYNGQSITGIGLTKAAHIYWRAQSVYQGPVSDFAAHADAIEQSCRDLVGATLPSLTTGAPSGEVITAFDCSQVAQATAAVEMRTPPTQCGFQPLLAQAPPAACPAGAPTPLFADGFDGGKKGGARWLVSHAGSNPEFTARDWGVVTSLPDRRPGYAIFAANPDIGTCSPGGNQAGLQRLESPEITIPAGVAAPRLSFDHLVATEAGFDGGNLKISVNGGAWQLVRAADFLYNPYNATLTTAAAGSDNPLAGQPAFSGSDGGTVGGTWGRSIVNLAPYAGPNDRIKLRFELGNDGCGGNLGWFVDDVSVYRCTP